MSLREVFKSFCNLVKLATLEHGEVDICFYSEGEDYWINFEKLIKTILAGTDFQIVYISSERNDPGLLLDHSNYKSFFISTGQMLNWTFQNIKTSVMVLTTPDLDNFQLKRSIYNVHYCYINHSLLSLHTGYKEGAFDAFDSIFCAGPHHINEFRAIEKFRGLTPKRLVKFGYPRIDALKENFEKHLPENTSSTNATSTVLLAPGWGENNIIDVCLEDIIQVLIDANIQVIFRPHPETIKHKSAFISLVLSRFKNNKLFKFNNSISAFEPFRLADVLISDWSGVVFDFSIITKKPVICVDLPLKIKNYNWQKLNLEPFEVAFRQKHTKIITVHKIKTLPELIDHEKSQCLPSDYCYNLGSSAQFGVQEFAKIIESCVSLHPSDH